MAHTDPFPSEGLKVIAQQVGKKTRGARLEPKDAAKPLFVGETFSEWVLSADKLTQYDKPFDQLVQPTRRWHHQIKSKDGAESCAYSVQPDQGSTRTEFAQLNSKGEAERIHEVIRWIDRNVSSDPVVRFLVVPAYHVRAFWLRHGTVNQVLLIYFPKQFTEFQYEVLYDAKQFLHILSRQSPAYMPSEMPPKSPPSNAPKPPASSSKRPRR